MIILKYFKMSIHIIIEGDITTEWERDNEFHEREGGKLQLYFTN